MIRVACPTCSETRDFSAHLAGWEVRCFWCHNPIPVPEQSNASTEPRRAMRAVSRRLPVARRMAEASRQTTRRVVEVATPGPLPPARPRRKRMSAGTWAGALAFGVTLIGVVVAVLIA